jgi:hypothetical protein
MKYLSSIIISMFMVACINGMSLAEINFDFENNNQGWEVPDWALEQEDCAGMFLEVASDNSSQQRQALKISCDFPGNAWTAAVIEYKREIDLEGYVSISAEVLLPEEAKGGDYQGRIILIAGSDWWWIEMRRSVPLTPGQWTTVKAKLDVNFANEKFFWKRQEGEESGILANIKNVKKIIIRVESEGNSGFFSSSSYKGPVYIDNVVIT